MSKHHHDDCCYPMYGYGGGYAGGGYTGTGSGWGIRWIYALLILIVIVMQFGRKQECDKVLPVNTGCDGEAVGSYGFFDGCKNGLIDNSVLFIIVVFLLILCAGCWWSGSGSSYGYGGGCGAF